MNKLMASIAMSCMTAVAHAAMAATYVYRGPAYATVTPPYTAGMGISGSFTTGLPLAANLVNTPIGPGGSNLVTSWSFNDGIHAFTDTTSLLWAADPDNFSVSTDAAGAITAFTIMLQSPLDSTADGLRVNLMRISSTSGEQEAADQNLCIAVVNEACSSLSDFTGAAGANGTFAFVPPPPPPTSAVSAPASNLPSLGLLTLLLLAPAFRVRSFVESHSDQNNQDLK